MPFSEARRRLSDLIDLVASRREHVVVTRNGRPEAVVISVDEYDALVETLAILDDPDAMRALDEADGDVAAGRVYTLDDIRRSARTP